MLLKHLYVWLSCMNNNTGDAKIQYCNCGCGERLSKNPEHPFPIYIKGHNFLDKTWRLGNPRIRKPKIEKECKYCSKHFYVYPSWNYVMFCSHACSGKWLSENLNGEKHPNFKGRISKICKVCGNEFIVATYYKNQIYCSTRCRRKQIKFVCLICNKEYFRRAYEKDISKVCSRACLN